MFCDTYHSGCLLSAFIVLTMEHDKQHRPGELEEHGLCVLCSEIRERGREVRELASALIRLQKTIAPVLEEYQKIKRSHPKCACCGIMTGPHHWISNTIPEPMVPRAKGQKRYSVCEFCYSDLKAARRSVPQQRKHDIDIDQAFRELDKLDGIEEDEI
jgi:hypothetical protein